MKKGLIFLCYRSVFEITLVPPHQYKKFKSYQTDISSFSWPLVVCWLDLCFLKICLNVLLFRFILFTFGINGFILLGLRSASVVIYGLCGLILRRLMSKSFSSMGVFLSIDCLFTASYDLFRT